MKAAMIDPSLIVHQESMRNLGVRKVLRNNEFLQMDANAISDVVKY